MARKQSELVTEALRRVEAGERPYAVAKERGIALSTIYRALSRLPRSHPIRRAHRRMRMEAIGPGR